MNQTNKVQEKQVVNYLCTYLNDPQLKVWHVMILAAILTLGYNQNRWSRIKVSRRMIMMLSHINTLPTYHKYFKELQDFGYINYKPSFHPSGKSVVELNESKLSQY